MIKGVSGASGAPAYQSAADPVADSIRNQIGVIEKQIKRLGQDKQLSPEELQKKKKEFEEKIEALNRQLQQHEIQKRAEESKAQAEAIKQRNEQYEQEKPPEEQEKDIQRELTYGFVVSQSHLYSAKSAEGQFNAAKRRKDMAVRQEASPEEIQKHSDAMDKAQAARGESAKKATDVMERMNERIGKIKEKLEKSKLEQEQEEVLAAQEAKGGADAAAESELPGAPKKDGAPPALSADSPDAPAKDEDERPKHVDISL